MRSVLRGALLLCAFVTVQPAHADVFINELHYDNLDVDTGEAVEVVATGGEDLSQYKLQFYNGSGGGLSASTSPNTQSLPVGALVSCGASVRIAVLNVNQIENGPDGIALLGPGDAVVQFISWEGVFTATAGAASGMLSQNIGQSETNSSPVGFSLQLGGGPSSTYAGFTWNASADDNFGACNIGQTFGAGVDNPPQLGVTVPTAGASNVAVGSTITLNFSESVTTVDPWFALDCAGNVPASGSGSGASRTITPDSALPFGTACTLTLTPANITDQDGTPDALSGTSSLAFNTQADLAPTVQSITPAHAASGIAVNTNVTLQFSENVLLTDPWITFDCVPSGNHPGTVSGGPATYVFDPGTNLTPGDACTVSLTAANVTDTDGGAALALSGQAVFTFSVAPDLLPTVQSSFPADGAVNVPAASNLSVTFSEPVTANASAFQLNCGAAAPFALSSGDQITYTIDPDSDLPANTACTLSVIAAEVADIDGTPENMAGNLVIDFTTSAGLAGYYDRVDASSCRALRATLHGVIDDHHSVSYTPVGGADNDTWDLLEPADQDPDNAGMILDVYENKKFIKGTERASSTCTGRYNREHTWPKSLGFPDETGNLGLPNAPHTDGHMLYLSNCQYNSNRGNNPYRDCNNPTACTGTDATQANYGVGGGGDNNGYTGSFYSVWSKRRGDVARAVLYMDVRYEGGTHSTTGQSEPDLVLSYGSDAGTPGSLDTLLAWHNADPPTNPAPGASAIDNIEPTRNDSIEVIQHNRNPLIDHPEWAALLFASSCTGPVVVAVDDDFTATQDTLLTVAAPGILRDDHNGSSKNGQGLTASITVPAGHGTATITNAATGAFTYQPQNGFCGSDEFTYQVSNGSVTDTGIAHIQVTCTTPDLPPVAVTDGYIVAEDAGTVVLQVTDNDNNPDGGPKFIQSVGTATSASVAIGAGGTTVEFTPNANTCVDTSFSYTLNGGSSTTVSIDMTCFNDPPSAIGTLADVSLPENSLVDIATAQVFEDVDGEALSYGATGLPGSLAINSGSGRITGTLTNADIGAHLIQVTATDASMSSANRSFTLTVTALGNIVFGDGFEN